MCPGCGQPGPTWAHVETVGSCVGYLCLYPRRGTRHQSTVHALAGWATPSAPAAPAAKRAFPRGVGHVGTICGYSSCARGAAPPELCATAAHGSTEGVRRAGSVSELGHCFSCESACAFCALRNLTPVPCVLPAVGTKPGATGVGSTAHVSSFGPISALTPRPLPRCRCFLLFARDPYGCSHRVLGLSTCLRQGGRPAQARSDWCWFYGPRESFGLISALTPRPLPCCRCFLLFAHDPHGCSHRVLGLSACLRPGGVCVVAFAPQ